MSILVAMVGLTWTGSLSRIVAFQIQQQSSDGSFPSTSAATVTSNWWPPSSSATISSVPVDRRRPGNGTGSSRGYDLYHSQDRVVLIQEQTETMLTNNDDYSTAECSPKGGRFLPIDPIAAAMLQNSIRQAACDSLIYGNRWKFCLAVWDDRLLDWLIGTACPGNFWTPKTYMITMATSNDDTSIDTHAVWHEWEGAKTVKLPARDISAEAVRKLRSLASRILPRLSNSGRRESDVPVFDTVIVTSSQLQCLLNQVAAEEARTEAVRREHQESAGSKKRRKKRKKHKVQDVPWVVSVPTSSESSISMLSLNVLQCAKQLIVVQDVDSWNVDMEDSSLKELLPQCLWLETSSESRNPIPPNNDEVCIPPQTPEEVPWGNW